MERTFEVTEDLLASKAQRLANFIIDYIIQIFIGMTFGIVFGLVCAYTDNYDLLYSFENSGKLTDYALGFSILFVYYTTTALLFKRSIGKFITKTIVVLEDGSIPDNRTFLRRTFCRMIPFEQFSFLGGTGRGWHDSISNTYVVRKEDFEKAKELFYSLEEIGKTEESAFETL